MSRKVKMEEKSIGATGSVDSISKNDKLEAIAKMYKMVKEATPDYEALEEEFNSFEVELPETIDIPDISKINQLYAIAQSFLTRTATLERLAINNHTLWNRLHLFMKAYIVDRESELLISDDFKDLKNKMQEANLRARLSKEYDRLNVLYDKCVQAESFAKIVKNKMSDLKMVVTNLNRQAKTLERERS